MSTKRWATAVIPAGGSVELSYRKSSSKLKMPVHLHNNQSIPSNPSVFEQDTKPESALWESLCNRVFKGGLGAVLKALSWIFCCCYICLFQHSIKIKRTDLHKNVFNDLIIKFFKGKFAAFYVNVQSVLMVNLVFWKIQNSKSVLLTPVKSFVLR